MHINLGDTSHHYITSTLVLYSVWTHFIQKFMTFEYWKYYLFQMPGTGGKEPEVVVNATAASGLDYHFKKDLLYWSDTETRKVSTTFRIETVRDENIKFQFRIL